MYEKQHKYKSSFARPEVRIKKEDNENIKAFLKEKGYNSINDYLNLILYADMTYNIIPTKAELTGKYPIEE